MEESVAQVGNSRGRQRRFLRRLRALLPKDSLILERERLRAYECDAYTASRCLPACVALPDNVEQVQAILRLCREEQVPVVARGAGTSLSGGARPVTGGLVLSMARFDRILSLDPEIATARVQPGVRNLAISEAAAPYGLFYAPDPSSQVACTIGGNVGENSGGVHCLKYGLTVHNVIGMSLVTMEGDRIEIGGTLDAPGYDLLALLCGSEGMLAVSVEITVRLLPISPVRQVLLAAFDRVEAAGEAVAGVIAAGIVPAGLEMMDRPCTQAVEEYIHAGYPTEAEAVLLCELDGNEEEVRAGMERLRRVLLEAGAVQLRIARDERERELFWAGRKAAFSAVGRIAPDYFCMDGSIPRRRIAAVLTRIAELAQSCRLRVVNVFHAGDGNLHPLILFDSGVAGELERARELGDRILELCLDEGGTITGEHGVGVEKLDSMCRQFNAGELSLMHAVKRAFDPEGLLNPGKAVPLLRRCAELGGMHVRHGNLPFRELERF